MDPNHVSNFTEEALRQNGLDISNYERIERGGIVAIGYDVSNRARTTSTGLVAGCATGVAASFAGIGLSMLFPPAGLVLVAGGIMGAPLAGTAIGAAVGSTERKTLYFDKDSGSFLGGSRADTTRAVDRIANEHLNAGRLQDAVDWFDKASVVCEPEEEDEYWNKKCGPIAEDLNQKGEKEMSLCNYEVAIELFHEALVFGKDPARMERYEENLRQAEILLKEETERSESKELKLREAGEFYLEGMKLKDDGDTFLAEGNYQKAREKYDEIADKHIKAIEILKKVLSSSEIEDLMREGNDEMGEKFIADCLSKAAKTAGDRAEESYRKDDFEECAKWYHNAALMCDGERKRFFMEKVSNAEAEKQNEQGEKLLTQFYYEEAKTQFEKAVQCTENYTGKSKFEKNLKKVNRILEKIDRAKETFNAGKVSWNKIATNQNLYEIAKHLSHANECFRAARKVVKGSTYTNFKEACAATEEGVRLMIDGTHLWQEAEQLINDDKYKEAHEKYTESIRKGEEAAKKLEEANSTVKDRKIDALLELKHEKFGEKMWTKTRLANLEKAAIIIEKNLMEGNAEEAKKWWVNAFLFCDPAQASTLQEHAKKVAAASKLIKEGEEAMTRGSFTKAQKNFKEALNYFKYAGKIRVEENLRKCDDEIANVKKIFCAGKTSWDNIKAESGVDDVLKYLTHANKCFTKVREICMNKAHAGWREASGKAVEAVKLVQEGMRVKAEAGESVVEGNYEKARRKYDETVLKYGEAQEKLKEARQYVNDQKIDELSKLAQDKIGEKVIELWRRLASAVGQTEPNVVGEHLEQAKLWFMTPNLVFNQDQVLAFEKKVFNAKAEYLNKKGEELMIRNNHIDALLAFVKARNACCHNYARKCKFDENAKKAKKMIARKVEAEEAFVAGVALWNDAWECEHTEDFDDSDAAERNFNNAQYKFEEASKLIPDNKKYQKWSRMSKSKVEGNASFNNGLELENEGRRLTQEEKWEEAYVILQKAYEIYKEAKTKFEEGKRLDESSQFDGCIVLVALQMEKTDECKSIANRGRFAVPLSSMVKDKTGIENDEANEQVDTLVYLKDA